MTSTLSQPSAMLTATSCCPSCGYNVPQTAPTQSDLLQAQQARIADLEAQIAQANQAATAAATRWKEYESELHTLRSQQQQQRPSTPQPQSSPQLAQQQSPPTPSLLSQGTTRLSSLLYPHKSTPNALSPPLPGSQSTDDLIEALTREQTLRREAENRLSATSKEVEELSASLFEQANEMVADERRARAKLEQRVGELEKRDGDKRRRLERLEGAMERIERVRGILDEK